jgi:formylglycine-generating enzyme required for sulfatase activity
VGQISWNDCQGFINKLQSKRPELKFSLPTEAKCENACRAESKTEFSFGDDPNGLSEYAWYDEDTNGVTREVGTKQPNAWGLYDMHGNAWEWCQDWFGKYSMGAAGPSRGSGHVIHGDSCIGDGIADGFLIRSSCRLSLDPEGRDNLIGLRVAAE